MQKYCPEEKCPKCGTGFTECRLVSPVKLAVTCRHCAFLWYRATLDSAGRINRTDELKAATAKTRARTIEFVAARIEGISVEGLPEKVPKYLAEYIRNL